MTSSTLTSQELPPTVPTSGGARPSIRPLLWILAIGAVVRVALLLWFLDHGSVLHVWDERDYNDLARNLVSHGQFAYTMQDTAPDSVPYLLPTSLRPPLYPALVATIYAVFGVDNFQAVRVFQVILSLLTVLLIYELGSELYGRRAGLIASGLYCFYPSMLVYNNLLLTEVLFTFLLCAACLCVARAFRRDSVGYLVSAGALLGLAALSRSILWLFPPLLAVLVLLAWQGGFRRRTVAVVGLVAAFAIVIAPWSIRNTQMHRSFVTIDVMGGRNFMMGNYRHTPLLRAWDAITLEGEQSWEHELQRVNPNIKEMTQGQIDKLALRHAIAFVRENPGLTLKRDVIKFFNFWGLERELPAGARNGYWGGLPTPAVILLTLLICGAYVFAMISGLFGMVVAPPPDRRVHLFLLLIIAYACGLHTLVFGHSRYHLSLIPLVLVFSAGALTQLREIWQRRSGWRFWLAGGLGGVFVLGWLGEALVLDLDRWVRAIY